MIRHGDTVDTLLTVALFVAVVVISAIVYVPFAVGRAILGERAA